MVVLQSEIDALRTKEREAEKVAREVRDMREQLEQQRRMEEVDHLKPLAIRAHDILCRWNHTDGCGWHYEIKGNCHHWTGTYSAHARWLKAVEEWTQHQKYGTTLTPEKLSELLDIIERAKAVHPDFLGIVCNVITRP